MNEIGLSLFGLGFAVGTIGTLIGEGGGFILVPVLLVLYPEDSPGTLTAISLFVIFCNSLSGSLTYAKQKRIHYRSTLLFSLAGMPGALWGAHVSRFLPRETFQLVFGVLLIVMAVYLFLGKRKDFNNSQFQMEEIRYNLPLGLAISAGVGFLSSLLGIGGGLIHVPSMVNLLNFPVHVATATSQSILAVMAATGSASHYLAGFLDLGWDRIAYLAPGVILGAQVGAHLAPRFKPAWIIRILAFAIFCVGLRFVFS